MLQDSEVKKDGGVCRFSNTSGQVEIKLAASESLKKLVKNRDF